MYIDPEQVKVQISNKEGFPSNKQRLGYRSTKKIGPCNHPLDFTKNLCKTMYIKRYGGYIRGGMKSHGE